MAVATAPLQVQKRSRAKVWTGPIVRQALVESLRKLDPRTLKANPIIFIVEIGAVLTSALWLRDLAQGAPFEVARFELQISLWLWFTVLFANFAEAIAEGRGKAQAAALRATRRDVTAK
jgi:K+-transporting ATPase ATPase B chain